MLKVRNGTKPDGPALCASCRSGTTMASGVNNKETTYCRHIGEFIKMKITQCSEYDDKAKPTLYQMESAAWILYTKRAGRDIGFMKASDFKTKFKKSILPDSDMPPPG